MTFASLSLTKAGQDQPQGRIPSGDKARSPRAWHKGLMGRRMWTLGITILYLVVYYPIGIAMAISHADYRAMQMGYDAAQTLNLRQAWVSGWIGLRQSYWVIPALLGIWLGIEGFSYLFSMVQMDFYESQPMPRKRRFARIYVNGVLIYLIPYVICYALAILIAAALGGMTGALLAESLIAMARIFLLFLVCYTVGVFSATIAGSKVMAACVAGVISLAEFVYYIALQSLMQTYFHTYYYGSSDGVQLSEIRWPWLTPFMRMFQAQSSLSAADNVHYHNYSRVALGKAMQIVLPSDLLLLGIGVVFLLAAYALFRKRRSEAAGGTVIYEAARCLLKWIVAIGGTLFMGAQVFLPVYQEISGDQRIITILVLATMMIAVVLVCGVIQGIYDQNARRFLGRFWQTVVAAAAVGLIFAIFRYDLTGYDRYLPAVSEVEYASLVTYDNMDVVFGDPDAPEDTIDTTEYRQDYMQLHDIYAVEQLAQIGQQAIVQRAEGDADAGEYWSAAIVYTLKSGKRVARQILIPYDIDSDLMDQIVGSDEYKEAYYPVTLADSALIQRTKDGAALLYVNGQDQVSGKGTLYEAFCEAYRKDLAQYNYSYATTHEVVGAVIYRYDGVNDGIYLESTFDVYEDYANTIAFLKENNLYLEALEVAGTTARITIDYYDDAYGWSVTEEFTDPDEIREILKASVNRSLSSAWKKDTTVITNYSIQTYSADPNNDSGYSARYFRADQIPDCVLERFDTQ